MLSQYLFQLRPNPGRAMAPSLVNAVHLHLSVLHVLHFAAASHKL